LIFNCGLVAGCLGFVSVVFDVQLRRFGGVMGGVVRVTIGRVGVVSGCLMVARLVMPGGFTMVGRRVLVVLSGFEVMLCCLL
jgi:hypothetical protein